MALVRYGEISRKLEDALEDYIQAATTELITTIPIVKGMDITELERERIEIVADNAVAERIGQSWTGNWTVDVSISYLYHYKDVTRELAQQRASELFDMFMDANINALINAASEVDGFTLYGDNGDGTNRGNGFVAGAVKSGIADQHTYSMTMNATAYCRPS